MKKRLLRIFALAVAAVCLFSQYAVAAVSPNIIRVNSNTEFAVEAAKIAAEYERQTDFTAEDCRIIGKVLSDGFDFGRYGAEKGVIGADGRFVLQFESEEAASSCLAALNADPKTAYAERDALICADSEEADGNGSLSWGTAAIEADKYSEYLGGLELERSVTVAIVDSGVAEIDFLKDKLVAGYDFIDADNDPSNDISSDSHGTFIASIIADCTQNAPVKIMPVRVIDSKNALIMNAVNGIYYAVDNGAQVLNASFGGVLSKQYCRMIDEALAYAQANDVCVVASAGNEGRNTNDYCPAHNISAITVTSLYEDFSFAEGLSNYGKEVDVCAPGMNITGYSASGELKKLSGTSMAAAFISASAALFRLDHPECNALQTQDAIKKSCADLGIAGFDIYYGYGIPLLSKFITDKTVYAEGISISQISAVLAAGESKALFAEVLPANASNRAVEWTSSAPQTVSVNSDGVLTALAEGTAVITAKSLDGEYEAKAEITVSGRLIPPSVVSLSVVSPPSKTKYIYKSGEQLELDGLALEAVYSDGSIETVTAEQGINVYGFSTSSVGEKTVTVEYGGYTASFKITVEYAWWQWIIRILLLGFLWY
ncbi:MAG: S8 family serine peptidase [Acutalibacteraceae bacterium]